MGLPVSGLPSPALNLGGGVRTRRPSAGRERTTREWMAHDTQYSIFMYSLGTTYTSYTDASFRSLCAAVSIMLRTTMRLMALSCTHTQHTGKGHTRKEGVGHGHTGAEMQGDRLDVARPAGESRSAGGSGRPRLNATTLDREGGDGGRRTDRSEGGQRGRGGRAGERRRERWPATMEPTSDGAGLRSGGPQAVMEDAGGGGDASDGAEWRCYATGGVLRVNAGWLADLGDASTAVGAADGLDSATAAAVLTTVASLLRHGGRRQRQTRQQHTSKSTQQQQRPSERWRDRGPQ